MAQIKRGDFHGLARVQVALIGTNGYAYGVAGTGMAAGATSGAYQITTPKSATLPNPTRNVINFTGGDRWLGSYQYGIDSVSAFDFSVSGYDADLIALVTGGAVDQTTNALWTMFSENHLAQDTPQLALLLTYRLQARGVNEGANLYVTSIIPRCWIQPTGPSGAPAYQSPGEYTFSVTPTAANVLPMGLPLSGTALNQFEDKAFVVHVISDYPLALATHIGGSGGSTDFTLPYLPLSEGVTLNSTENFVCLDGTPTAATTVNTTTGVVTMAVGEGVHAGVMYATNFAQAA